MKKTVLIIALNENWTGISRLPSGLSRAGFKVFALCPKKSLIAKTKYLANTILYPTFTYSRSKLVFIWMIFAMLKFRPDVVLPGDEDAILAMQELARLTKKIPFLSFISKVFRESLGPEEFDSLVLSKSDFQAKCKEWGVRTPQNIIVNNLDEAIKASGQMTFPLVIKHDSGYGGSGVHICENSDELKKHFQQIGMPSLMTKVKNQIKKLFFVTVLSSKQSISLQQYIDGVVGLAPFCAQDGEVFAINQMMKIRTFPGKTGPTAVAEGIDNEELKIFVKTVAKKLSLNGFNSLDFIIDSKNGTLFIIELNPRPTPSCHIGEGHIVNDLCEFYFNGLNNKPLMKKSFHPYVIAMYPGEKRRDPQSEYIKSSFHDVPTDDPELYQAIEKLYS